MKITKFGTISYNEESDELKLDGFDFDAEGAVKSESPNKHADSLLLCIIDFLRRQLGGQKKTYKPGD